MPKKCAVFGCRPNENDELFDIPKVPRKSCKNKLPNLSISISLKRRNLWLKTIGCKLTSEKEISKFCAKHGVCGRHFYLGHPADLEDKDNIDWYPRLQLSAAPNDDVERQVENEATEMVREIMKSLTGPAPAQSASVFLPNQVDSDEEMPADLETIYECGFCKYKFNSIPDINSHIETEHSDTRQAGDDELMKKGRPILKTLLRRLETFDWCDCRICVTSLHNLLSHVHEMHQPSWRKWESVLPEVLSSDSSETEELAPKDKLPSSTAQLTSETVRHPRMRNNFRRPQYTVVKAGEQKIYKCSRCKSAVPSFDLVEHNKKHLEETSHCRIYTHNEAGPFTKVIEFQCNACGTVHDKRADALDCLQQHADNDWPLTEDAAPYWKTLLGANKQQTERSVDDLAVESDRLWQKWHHPFRRSDFKDPTLFYQCAPCKKYYDVVAEAQKHMLDVHGKTGMLEPANRIPVKRTISCQDCVGKGKVEFGDVKTAMRHRIEKHSNVMDIPEEQVITRLQFHMDGSEWAVSGRKVYLTKNLLEEYECVCGLLHKSKHLLSNCLAKHVGIRRYKCGKPNMAPQKGVAKLCGIPFFNQEGLDNHDLQAHTFAEANNSMECPHCGVKRTPAALRMHILTHGIDLSTCEICGKSFRADRLAWHLKRVHQPKEQKYRCEVCFKRFAFRSSADRCVARHKILNNV